HHHLGDPVRLTVCGVVLRVRTWPAKHRDDGWLFLSFDFAGVGPAHALARHDSRLRPVVVLHDTDVSLCVFLKRFLFPLETFRRRVKQLAGPGVALDPLPCFRTADGLYRFDACLTALAAFDKGLKHVNAMEDGALIGSAANHDWGLYRRVDGEGYLWRTKVGRAGGTASQG